MLKQTISKYKNKKGREKTKETRQEHTSFGNFDLQKKTKGAFIENNLANSGKHMDVTASVDNHEQGEK